MRGAALALAAIALPGCASIMEPGPSIVEVVTEGPPGEAVTVVARGTALDDEVREKGAKVRLKLDRPASYAVLVAAEGYHPVLTTVRSYPTGAIWLNYAPMFLAVLAGGALGSTNATAMQTLVPLGALASLAGLTVDLLNRHGGEHQPKRLEVRLAPREEARP